MFDSQDKELKEIVQAARATLAQNSVDLLTDCPSRERAGWLANVYFSMEAERIEKFRKQGNKYHIVLRGTSGGKERQTYTKSTC